MIHLIGGNGRLGQAIAQVYDSSVSALARARYADWWRAGASDDVSRYFERGLTGDDVVFVAAGLLDPRIEPEALRRVNFDLPRNVAIGAGRLGMKVVTFGTVMEVLAGSANAYVQSKAMLGEFVDQLERAGSRVLHLRIHTLYGIGEPSPFMFLGQMLDAIRRQAPFEMSAGLQLREYHHVEDDARAIRLLVESGCSGAMDLSHGDPLSLRDLARHVFDTLGCPEHLRIGYVDTPSQDNFDRVFIRPEPLRAMRFRDTRAGILDYLRPLIAGTDATIRGLTTDE